MSALVVFLCRIVSSTTPAVPACFSAFDSGRRPHQGGAAGHCTAAFVMVDDDRPPWRRSGGAAPQKRGVKMREKTEQAIWLVFPGRVLLRGIQQRGSNEALPPSDGVRTVHGKQRLAEKEKVGRRNTNCFCPSLYPVFSLPFSSISILPPSRLVAFLSLSVSRRRRRYCAAAAPPPPSSPNAFMWC